jgi:PleD family two-component response regulator
MTAVNTERAEPAARDAEAPDPARKRTRLLVVDDPAPVRAGLREVLTDEADFEVVAAVGTAEAAMLVAEGEAIDRRGGRLSAGWP